MSKTGPAPQPHWFDPKGNAMQANVITADTLTADTLGFASTPSVDIELLKLWLVRVLTVLLILIGVVLTFYIMGTLGFAVYGLPRASFRRRAAIANAA
jgi:hypothetical protein